MLGSLIRRQNKRGCREVDESHGIPVLAAVDCHTHLLPGIDDGAGSWGEAVQLAKAAWSDGTRYLMVTPHYLPGAFEPEPEVIDALAAELVSRLRTAGIRLEIYTGCEAYLCPEIPTLLSEGKLSLLGKPVDDPDCSGRPRDDAPCHDGVANTGCLEEVSSSGCDPSWIDVEYRPYALDTSAAAKDLDGCPRGDVSAPARHLMVEMPHGDIPSWADDVLFRLAIAGVTPVLAHPERCAGIRRNPSWIMEAVRKGALVQVNALSLTGGYGREVEKAAVFLLRSGMVHFIGSDAHSLTRPPLLRAAADTIMRWIGERAREEITWHNPLKLLRNAHIKPHCNLAAAISRKP